MTAQGRIRVQASDLDTLLQIERPVSAGGFRGAGQGRWEAVDEAWANLLDLLPSRSEDAAGGIPVSNRRSRVRMRYRDDILPSMRLVLGDRIMAIVAGPVELGRRDGVEMMVEEYSSPGNTA